MSFPIQTLVVNPSGKKKHTIGPLDAQVSLVNKDGTDFSAGSSAYELPAAGEDTPTKDEFDKLVTAFNTLAKQFDDIIAGLVSAGAVKLPDKK